MAILMVWGVEKNKANQSQFEAFESPEGMGKRGKTLEAANPLTG
jgi:hypothetical protein